MSMEEQSELNARWIEELGKELERGSGMHRGKVQAGYLERYKWKKEKVVERKR